MASKDNIDITISDENIVITTFGDAGPPGAEGPQGIQGENGLGVPIGGGAKEVLTKIDATDNNTEWSLVDHVDLLNNGSVSHADIDLAVAASTGHIADSTIHRTISSTDILTNKTIADVTNTVHANSFQLKVRNTSGGTLTI